MGFHTGQPKHTFYKGYKKEHRVRGIGLSDLEIFVSMLYINTIDIIT